ncbi:MAG TPA: cytochrome biogenesis protein, partial [Gammaproteobacteria bacterium]|nr:cytochrome biogenesis protein [Gammaproteobacteria bacterium]
GLIWGWLPCGMVYAAIAWALTSGSALNGALLMLAFGLGTLPMLLAVGFAAEWLRDFVRHPWVRRAAGLTVLMFGVVTLLAPGGHDHPSSDTLKSAPHANHHR